MTIYGLFYSFNTFFFLEVMSTQQAEVVVWVNVVQGEDKIYQGLPAVESMSGDSVWCKVGSAVGCVWKMLVTFHLEDSASGPTGDFESSKGEQSFSTSSSRFLQSFRSSPASLPA